MIRLLNTHDYSCFLDACSDAGLPTESIPIPTTIGFIKDYCNQYNLHFLMEKVPIIIPDEPGIVFLKTSEKGITHTVYLEIMSRDWQYIKNREVIAVICVTPNVVFDIVDEIV